MRLTVAQSAGFCFGVKRAMDMALEAAQRHPKHLYTLGPLIHNPQAVESLEQLGVMVRERIEDIPRGTVIFRSHGVSSQDLQKARKKGLRIIDATCPIVKRAQFYAKFLHRHGYALLIVGDAHHPEVEAIRSYVDKGVVVVDRVEAVKGRESWTKLGIIAQSTQSGSLFRQIVAACLDGLKEVRVFNTICHATTIRQREAVAIARKADCMIVIGGYNSGNTQRLASICREIQPNTYHIEKVQELDPNWLRGRRRFGITAGASTPSWVIQQVQDEIKRLEKRSRGEDLSFRVTPKGENSKRG